MRIGNVTNSHRLTHLVPGLGRLAGERVVVSLEGPRVAVVQEAGAGLPVDP